MSPFTESISVLGERQYETPVLRVYGTIAAVTATASMSGTLKDGGPNNIKS